MLQSEGVFEKRAPQKMRHMGKGGPGTCGGVVFGHVAETKNAEKS